MRKLVISLGVATIGMTGLLIACSSDDDPAPSTNNNTNDSGVADTSTPTPTDSGSTVDSGADAGTCQSCSDFLEHGPGEVGLCENNGPPTSATLADNWFTKCVCVTGANGCMAQCADTCTTFAAPSDTCVTCFQTVCADSFNACAADGADAGH